MDLMYHTVRENNRAFFLPEPIALLLAKPREFLLKRVSLPLSNPPPPFTKIASMVAALSAGLRATEPCEA